MSELARWSDDETLTLSAHAARARVELRDLTAEDGIRINCTFIFGIQAVDQPADRKMLEEVFHAGSSVVRAEDVVNAIKPGLVRAANRVLSTRPASEWVADPDSSGLREALLAAARAGTFTCGVAVVAPFEVQLQSPVLEKLRLERLQRQLLDDRAVSRRERIKHSADVMAEFLRLRQQAPDVPAGKLLEQIDPTHTSALLETMLMASAGDESTGRVLYVVAGNELIEISPADGSLTRTTTLPDSLGPVRSVTLANSQGHPVLLIGARSGLMVVAAASLDEAPSLYRVALTSQLGFNRAALLNGRLYASHGDAQLVCWELERPGEPIDRIEPFPDGHPRNVLSTSGGQILCTSGTCVIFISAEHLRSSIDLESEIVSLLPLDHQILAVTADGSVHRIDVGDRAVVSSVRHTRAVSAAALLPWLDEPRLLLGTADGPVLCAGIHDSLVTQYVSSQRGVRAVAASRQSVVALTADRQRLVFWDSWDGKKPAHELHIAQRFKHRVADLCFA